MALDHTPSTSRDDVAASNISTGDVAVNNVSTADVAFIIAMTADVASSNAAVAGITPSNVTTAPEVDSDALTDGPGTVTGIDRSSDMECSNWNPGTSSREWFLLPCHLGRLA